MRRVLLTCMVLLCLLVTGCRRIRTGSVAMNGHKINLHDIDVYKRQTYNQADNLIPVHELQSICKLFYRNRDKMEKNKPKERVACFFM